MSTPVHRKVEPLVEVFGTPGFCGSDNMTDAILRRQFQKQMDVVRSTVDLSDQNLDRASINGEPPDKIAQDVVVQGLSSELSNQDNVVAKSVNTVCLTEKFVVRGEVVEHLDSLYRIAQAIVPKILQ